MKPTLGRTIHLNISLDAAFPIWAMAVVIQEETQIMIGGVAMKHPLPLLVRVFVASGPLERHALAPTMAPTCSDGVGAKDIEVEPLGEGDGPGHWRWPPRVA